MEITISEIPIPKNISNSARVLVDKKSLYMERTGRKK